jgi:hypothetical protein
MTNRDPERISDEQTTTDVRERLSTADMAAAATAPTRTGQDEAVKAREAGGEGSEPLFDDGESGDFRSRWYAIQGEFVDQPRESVEKADELVATVMKRLAEIFAAERENLEHEWGRGDDVSTEDLRIALRRYRSFFDRLLSV